ncbi:MAG TPA: serine/threonine-protein kinase [Enhygromyxa sp.]|nr:serine/threonine-protein kinase [Enhygromyxa sp.]
MGEPGDAVDPATPDPALAPVRLGHHVLLHKLGKGGMGIVYAAYDERLDRRVAIKLLRTRGRKNADIRLKREAQALARLSHPNVVQIYEIGEFEQQPFLVMELIEGVTLGHWRAERSRTRAEILAVFLAAGRGLAAAHAKGLVHRDFKPDNVMIRRDGHVVVMDFGLARGDERSSSSPDPADDLPTVDARELELPNSAAANVIGSSPRSSELENPLTVAGKVLGTPGYMAPEQLFGEPVHAGCDQFSFCVSLWEALYDQRPFRGQSLAAFAQAVMHDRPTPSETSEVPAWLRKVLERGLARSPDDRWPSMNALLDALQRDPTKRRRRLLLAAGVLVSACLAAAAVQGIEQRQRERSELARAEQLAACELEGQQITDDWNDVVAQRIEQTFLRTSHPFASAAWQHTRPWLDDYAREWSALRTQACVDASVDHSRSDDSHARTIDCLDEGRIAFVGVLDVLSGLTADDAQMVTSATLTAARLSPPASCSNQSLLRQLRRPPAELRDTIAQLRARLERARARSYAGDHARALVEAQAVLDEADALAWTPLLVQAGTMVAFTQFRLGKYEDAERSAEQAFLHAAASDDELGMLLTAAELATVLGTGLARYDDARRWALLAKALVERLELGGTAHEAQVLTRFAALLTETGAYADALPHQQRALQIYEAVLGPQHPTAAIVLLNLGVTQDRLGQHQAALTSYERGIEVVKAVQGPEHSNLGYFYNSVGTTSVHLCDFAGALAAYQRALDIWELALGVEHPTVALVQSNLAALLCRKHECEAALILHRRALQTLEHKQGPEHPQVGTTLARIGVALQTAGQLDEAAEHHRRALAILETAKGAEHHDTLVIRMQLGSVLREQGHPAAAIEHIRPALEVLERTDGPAHVIRFGLVELALALLDTGELATARAQLERALALFEQPLCVDRADASFALARVLWASGERADALTLAESAREGYVASGDFGARGLAKLDGWLATHTP